MVTVKGKATIPVSGSGDRASLEVVVAGCTSNHICLVTPAEMEDETTAQGDQSDFYAICGTDKITIYSEDKQLGGATDVYYFVTDGVFDSANIVEGSVDVDKIEGLADGAIIIGVDGTAANNAKVVMIGDGTLANDGTLTIANDAITTAKILDANVTSAKLAPGVVANATVIADLGAPALADEDYYITSTAVIDGSVTGTDYTLAATNADVPRNITITVTSATISAGTVTVEGENIEGDTITEVLNLADALTSEGTQIFVNITDVIVADTADVDPADRITVGFGDVIGLPSDITATTAVKRVYFNGALIAAPVLSAGVNESGVDVSAETYDGTKVLKVFYNVGE